MDATDGLKLFVCTSQNQHQIKPVLYLRSCATVYRIS